MLRKLLYNHLQEYREYPFWVEYRFVTDKYKFDELIGFDKCYDIIVQIKDNIAKDNHIIYIKDCEFIERIELDCVSNIGKEDILGDEVANYSSKLVSYRDKVVRLELQTYDWEEDKHYNLLGFPYKIIRYPLLLAYYKYLKETNPNHIFVQYVEFLSRLCWHDPGHERYISLKEYVYSLQEIEHREIDEDTIISQYDGYRKLKSMNHRKFYFELEYS